MIVSLDNVCKSFGASLILQDITARIEDHDFIGLVGVNGAGKSTLLNIINGDLDCDTGEISRNSAARFGFLRQNSGLLESGTILSEMRGVFSHLWAIEEEMRNLEERIADIGHAHTDYPALASRYDTLQTRFEAGEGYLVDVRIATVLNGMGFGDVDRATPVSVLSGGEKTRLAICKLLLESPDLLILDEPTNHLDFRTLSWLEDYLQSYKGALLVVSHDRYFLDRLCNQIWDVFDHNLQCYNGNYSSFIRQKDERFERQMKEYNLQQQEIADMKDFVARNIVRASTTNRAKSRQKALDRMDVIEKPKMPPKPAKISFEYKREPVKDVLHVENLSLSVNESDQKRVLFHDLNFDMLKGDKIALIGANGIGKSSFLKAIQNLFPHDSGTIEWGRGVDISYFEQEELMLDSSKTALNELWDRFPREYEHTIRTVLGHVQITGENIYKKVGDLSGGERARIKFAILALSCGNVLIMDEPTNHLDLATKEVLDQALQDYTGTLLVVSHDRYLLNKFPSAIAEMHEDGLRIYKGNYASYLIQKEKERAQTAHSAPIAEPEPKDSTPNAYYRSKKQRSEEAARRNRVATLEKTIEMLEVTVWNLENEIALPETAADYVLLQEKCAALEEKKLELSIALSEWSELVD
ncbi:MAG: ABC-F family ATP-binding cassette domain-containing protein [Oscillospiraceae bacterium]|jgi:ATP-binding cassette subfamily F protein 3|nr:ABC-F family ATP-binding cassette domain-containing protein [Oscillospiraceae bacterium]